MSNRRRSERYKVRLPVGLNDEGTLYDAVTVDVSQHGVAILAPIPLKPQQYVELELTLPPQTDVRGTTIRVTAIVARQIEETESENGDRGPGIGLDFLFFDVRAKGEWQKFMQGVRRNLSGENPSPTRSPSRVIELGGESVPTFIVKPRDLARLWSFFRGELARTKVRIETPVAPKSGAKVELLVVHPNSEAEWILAGRVAKWVEQGRGGRPVLEIDLLEVDSGLRAAFRNFVATGQGMIEEEVSAISEIRDALPLPIPDAVSDTPEILTAGSLSGRLFSAFFKEAKADSPQQEQTLEGEIFKARAQAERQGDDATPFYRLGTLLARVPTAELRAEAISAFRRVLNLEPNHPGAHHALAEVLAKQGAWQEASQHLQRARRLGYLVDERLERRIADHRK